MAQDTSTDAQIKAGEIATETAALTLTATTVIAIVGSPTDRRALLRLPNGRIVPVTPGARTALGTVRSLTETSLTLVNGEDRLTLSLPG